METRCWKCKGSGVFIEETTDSFTGNALPCPACKGTGKVNVELSKSEREF
jgi:DnaJ-class molecular chaperone